MSSISNPRAFAVASSDACRSDPSGSAGPAVSVSDGGLRPSPISWDTSPASKSPNRHSNAMSTHASSLGTHGARSSGRSPEESSSSSPRRRRCLWRYRASACSKAFPSSAWARLNWLWPLIAAWTMNLLHRARKIEPSHGFVATVLLSFISQSFGRPCGSCWPSLRSFLSRSNRCCGVCINMEVSGPSLGPGASNRAASSASFQAARVALDALEGA